MKVTKITLEQEAKNVNTEPFRLTQIFATHPKKFELAKLIAANTATTLETLKEIYKIEPCKEIVLNNETFYKYCMANIKFLGYETVMTIYRQGRCSLIFEALSLSEHFYTDSIFSILRNEKFYGHWNTYIVPIQEEIIKRVKKILQEEGIFHYKYNDLNIMLNYPDELKDFCKLSNCKPVIIDLLKLLKANSEAKLKFCEDII